MTSSPNKNNKKKPRCNCRSSNLVFLFGKGNLLRTPDGKLAFIDFGMMADIDEEDRYGLFGLVIGLQNKDLPLVTENLLKVSKNSGILPTSLPLSPFFRIDPISSVSMG